jgi:hypothetical protein
MKTERKETGEKSDKKLWSQYCAHMTITSFVRHTFKRSRDSDVTQNVHK